MPIEDRGELDLIIIGGGISGLLTAYYLKDLFREIIVFEEDKTIGEPEHCTGIVSKSFLILTDLSKDSVLGKYRYMEIVDKKFRTVAELRFREYIYMIDRAKVEREVYEKIESDIKVFTSSKVYNIHVINDTIRLQIHSRSNLRDLKLRSSSTLVAVCEGARQHFSRAILNYRSRTYTYGVQCDCICKISKQLHDDTIYIVYDDSLSDNYFSWIVPTDSFVRLGLGCRQYLYSRFNKLLKLANVIKTIKTFGGKIILDKCPSKIHWRNIVFIGDSVSFVKPLTGGGNTFCALAAHVFKMCAEKFTYNPYVLAEVYSKIIVNIIRRLQRGAVALREILFKTLTKRLVNSILLPFVPLFDIEDFDIQGRYVEHVKLSCNFHEILKIF